MDLQDRLWVNNPLEVIVEIDEESEEEEFEIIEEPPIDYNALYEEALKAKEVILAEAKKQVSEMIEEAHECAQIMEQKAATESQRILQEANTQADKMIQTAKQEVEHLIEVAYQEKQQILNQAEPEVVEIIETLVGHIIHEEVARNNKWIAYIVKKMIMREKIIGGITVYVSPQVLESITEEEYKSFEQLKQEVILRADEEVNSTTCLVETSEGSILYDLSEGLDRILLELNMLKQLKVEKAHD